MCRPDPADAPQGPSRASGAALQDRKGNAMTDGERIGRRFGRLVVVGIRRERRGKRNEIIAHCRCDCGSEKDVFWQHLADGRVKSCGCLNRELTAKRGHDNARHGGCGTRLYRIWSCMKQRCHNHHHVHFANYGGRGIAVCPEWRGDFAAFREWAMSHGYADTLSIDRIDNDRGYSPDNCRWADALTQGNHRKANRVLTVAGQSHTVSEWARLAGIGKTTIKERLRRGWSEARAVGVCDE